MTVTQEEAESIWGMATEADILNLEDDKDKVTLLFSKLAEANLKVLQALNSPEVKPEGWLKLTELALDSASARSYFLRACKARDNILNKDKFLATAVEGCVLQPKKADMPVKWLNFNKYVPSEEDKSPAELEASTPKKALTKEDEYKRQRAEMKVDSKERVKADITKVRGELGLPEAEPEKEEEAEDGGAEAKVAEEKQPMAELAEGVE